MSRTGDKFPGWVSMLDPDPLTVEPPPEIGVCPVCGWPVGDLTGHVALAHPKPEPRRAGCSVFVIAVLVLLSSAPAPVTAEEPPAGEVGTVLLGGTLSYVDPKYGPDYLALPFPRGTVAEVCGPGGCVTRRSTDFGPDQRVHPNRIADLSAADFVFVCGVPLSVGLCRGTVELEPPVAPDDDRMRDEVRDPLPATSTVDAP